MVDTSELQIRTMEQLLEDFDGEVESALKMKNLIYTLFQRPTGPEDGEEIPVADQGGAQVNGLWSSDNGGPVLPANAAIAADGISTTVVDASGTQAQATIEVGAGAIASVELAQSSNCIVEDGDTTTVDGVMVTLDVAGGSITGGALSATSHIVENGDTGDVRDQAGNTAQATFSVASGAISQIEFTNGTDAIVSDGETPPVTGTGTTATIQVTNGSVSIVLS